MVLCTLLYLMHIPDAREALKLVERGVTHKEAWYISRGVRSIHAIRKRQNDTVLRRLIVAYFPTGNMILLYIQSST